ncbi:DUF5825 family protein [Actinophytocola sp.]|uniref:DUF5825 family protein n=1 Tax=Actinophytocola sp. TaxID=1872138 RepID=UPI002D7F0DE5|nr:DUF5825 family protein [Actinophytocola sp.]HET9141710.1 DUF5825 family protein [Actinophytocola sp.]
MSALVSAPATGAADPRICSVAGRLTSDSIAAIDPVALSAAGHETLVLAEPVEFGRDDERDVRFLRLLREAVSVTMRVDWSAASPVPFELPMVHHLPPPRREHDAGTADGWRQRFRFGLSYYRVGPGFLQLKDVRDGAARYRLDDPKAVASWSQLEQVRHLTELSPDGQALYELLAGEGLIMRRGAWVTLLPFRMRRWPVPFNGI